MPTENENYQELWLHYYNILVGIIREYNTNKDSPRIFVQKVKEIL